VSTLSSESRHPQHPRPWEQTPRTMHLLLKLCALLLAAGLCQAKVCNHSCSTVQDVKDGTKVPDPTNCYRYYVCSDPEGDDIYVPSDDPVDCPNGKYFDPDQKACVTTPSSGPSKCELCNPCAVECLEEGTLVPDPYSCTGYYICLQLDDSPRKYECGGGETFNFTSQACEEDLEGNQAACYRECDPCETYCIEEGRVPNPHDCTGYYYCEPPDGLASFHCKADEWYNFATEVCEDDGGESCTPTCPDDSSSTTVAPATTDANTTPEGDTTHGRPTTTTEPTPTSPAP